MTSIDSSSATPDTIQAKIRGDISGQVAIGRHIVQVGSNHGILIIEGQEHAPRARQVPISMLPRHFTGLLNREAEIATVTSAFESTLPAEFHGEPGIGKTSLLRSVAYHPTTAAFRDGVIYVPARHQRVSDLLQSLFDAFYESDGIYKPTEGQLRSKLRGKQALVLLDDVEFDRDDLGATMDAAPGCIYLLTSTDRRLWGEGRSVALPGLPAADALALVERELGRNLTNDEQPAIRQLCTTLNGNPLRLLQAAAMAREEGLTLPELTRRIRSASPADALANEIIEPLTEPERRTLAALAAFGTASIHPDHLAAITQIPDSESVLDALAQRNLALAASPRVTAAATITPVTRTWDLDSWRVRSLTYFTSWANEHAKMPERVLEEADGILHILRWATIEGRWSDVLELGRAVEGPLAVGRRWGAWEQVLHWIIQAARALGDQAVLALGLHQLGSRALCLEDTATARATLTEALEIREALGDELGAAITRNNLGLTAAPAVVPEAISGPRAPTAGPTISIAIVLSVAATLIAALVLGMGGWYLLSAVAGPSDLTAAVVPGITEIALEWTDNSDNEDGFIIERRARDETFSELDRVGANATAYSDAGAEPGITYTYRVRAFNAWVPGFGPRESEPSNEASASLGVSSALFDLTIDPAQVTGGESATGTVTFNRPAPDDGLAVALSSTNADVIAVPATMTVEPGQSHAGFDLETNPVAAPTEVIISAALDDVEQTFTVTVMPPTLGSLSCQPQGITGGEATTCTITLNGAAPKEGIVVSVRSSSEVARVDVDAVVVPAGDRSVAFDVQTSPVDEPIPVRIIASVGESETTFDVILSPAPLPDLIVVEMQIKGEPWIDPTGSVKLPIRVTIRNTGSAASDLFKVGIEFAEDGYPYAAAFTVQGEDSVWYPSTDAPLAPGGEVAFEGIVTFRSSRQGQTVSLWAIADSCSGDEHLPEYCRVEELDEGNNQSDAVPLDLPAAADLRPVPDAFGFFCQFEQGQLLVIVTNQGSGPAAPSTTRVDFGDFGSEDVPTPELDAGTSERLLLDTPSGCYDSDCDFTITVDIGNDVFETVEHNNAAAGSCVG